MKHTSIVRIVFLTAITAILALFCTGGTAQEPTIQTKYEYATIRWAGRDNTHVIRNGQVEFIGHELRKMGKPDRADERSFYMNLAMNGLAKDGFKVVGISNDDIVMERPVTRK